MDYSYNVTTCFIVCGIIAAIISVAYPSAECITLELISYLSAAARILNLKRLDHQVDAQLRK
eukprot:5083731-Amphidinium_carterae.1